MGFSINFKRPVGLGGAFAGLALVAALSLIGGCDTNLSKGWFDPTEMGRFSTTPVTVRILKNLDTGFEEPDQRFENATDIRPSDLVNSATDYVIGRNDLVSVSIVGLVQPEVESQITRRVSESGTVSLPYLGAIKAAGLTEPQLEQAVQEAYRDKNIIQKAQVSVVTVEARNRTFSIYGAVTQAGQYAILDSNFRLMDALVLSRDVTSPTGIEYIYVLRKADQEPKEGAVDAPATGKTPGTPLPTPDALTPRSEVPGLAPKYLQAETGGAANAPATVPGATGDGRTITVDGKPMQIQGGQIVPATPVNPAVSSPVAAPTTSAPSDKGFEFSDLKEPSDVRVIRVPFEKLKQGDLKYNIVIRPLDYIWVPQPVIGEYYMGGHIARTGVYSLTARDITLRSAVIAAGGLDQLAIPERTEIVRKVNRFQKVYSQVNLAKVFSGDEPDILLKPDDEIMVGTNASAPFLAAFRAAFRITYGFGFIYDRNMSSQTGGINW